MGLAQAEAQARLEQHGPNRLAQKPPRSPWLLLFDQFKNLLVLVLIGAAILAGSIGDVKDTIVILIVVVLNALLGFYQEFRAEKTLAALKKMLANSARVRRGGQVHQIPADELAPGDIVLMEAGDRVPVDGRIVAVHTIEINEAVLTGESQAVTKVADRMSAPDAPLAERFNLAYMNTVVTRGRAELLVTATGMATEMGWLTGMLQEAEEKATPLQIQLDQFGKRLALIAGVVVMVIFALGILRDQPLVQTIMTSIALAVASIPEGLPAVVTVTLAIGMHRMAKNRAIVKRLAAVETLGCTTVICSDKTGTLTLNQMTARAVHFAGRGHAVSGEGYRSEGAIFTVLAATLTGLPTPFTAVQILRANIIMDGPPAMTLGVDPARPGIMNDPPRDASARMLTGSRLLRLVFFGAIMCAGTLAMFFHGRAAVSEAYGLTLVFTTFVIFQFFNVFNARAEAGSAFDRNFFRNWKLWIALMAVLVLQVVVVHWPPAQGVFDTVALAPADWVLAFAVASSVLILEEVRKAATRVFR